MTEQTDSPISDQQPAWRRPPGCVVVVLPAYNEAENIPPLLESIDQTMYSAGMQYQLIVVDDGSDDDTASIAESYSQQMPVFVEIHEQNQGLGGTIRDGLRIAAERSNDHDLVIVMDADNTHTPGLMLRMTREIQEGADVVIASRYREGAMVRGVPIPRVFLSWGASWLMRFLFPTPGVRDYTCGYRAYRASVLKKAFDVYGDTFVNQEGFQCMVDILLKLRRMDMVFREVPLILRYDLKGGASKMRVMRTVINTLGLLFKRRLGG